MRFRPVFTCFSISRICVNVRGRLEFASDLVSSDRRWAAVYRLHEIGWVIEKRGCRHARAGVSPARPPPQSARPASLNCPDISALPDISAIDLIERAVSPAIQRNDGITLRKHAATLCARHGAGPAENPKRRDPAAKPDSARRDRKPRYVPRYRRNDPLESTHPRERPEL